ncbi:MAG: TRAM domain-containing protein [Chlamydiia bacterium]|nr:TRAM domain-containing protein [Chlamydiia bacterium]
MNLGLGVLLGGLFSALLIGFDILFRRFNLRSFNIAVVGIFFGYLMGQALVLILKAILGISAASIHLSPQGLEILQILLFLFGIYTGTLMTLRSADELYVSIPFIRFSPTAHKKKDLLVDISLLSDARVIDLASSGLLNCHLVLPKFVIKELYAQSESADALGRMKAKRALDVFKKLEGITELELRLNDTDFPEVKDLFSKMLRLARFMDASILTADVSQIQVPYIEGLRIINIHDLSKSLKPLMQTGEHIKITIQRYGKEPRQGVGYLEDGTMVVVNGGGQFIGEMIEVQVLSVKHTASGRMVFCNTLSAMKTGDMNHFHEDSEEQ